MSMTAPVLPPLLREGDQLTSAEFMRRWEAMPELKHAELIDGTVYMASPVSYMHADFHGPLATWAGNYAAQTRGCWSSLDGTWLMGQNDVPQPDIALRILAEHGGQSKLEGNYLAGAPELVVEVSASSRIRDLGSKLKLYERVGVREYLIAATQKQEFIWKILGAKGYDLLGTDADGIMRSRFFPGLWLDTAALWNRDQARVLAVLQEGLATPEHAAFVSRLATRL